MKKLLMFALVFILTMSLFTGCFGRKENGPTIPSIDPTTAAPSTRPTTRPTTEPTMPSMEDLIPGTEDTIDPNSGENGQTIDPTNGANRKEDATGRRATPRF